MTIDQSLKEEIIKVSGLGKSRTYEIIKELGKELLISKENAAYYYAKSIGIDIRQFVQDKSILDLIRNLSSPKITHNNKPQSQAPKPEKDSTSINIPFLSPTDIKNCQVNSELYSRFYYFENSIRRIIINVLELEFGQNWWNLYIKKKISSIDTNVAVRKADEKNTPWHSGRGVHNIYYTDLDDLRQIIENNYKKLFSKTFSGSKNLKIFIGWIFEIEHSRNILAHNNPLSKKDAKRMIQITSDFIEMSTNIIL